MIEMNQVTRSFGTLLLSLVVAGGGALLSGQEIRSDRRHLEINDIVLELEGDETGTTRAVTDLGGLIANKTYQIDFRIQNPLDHDIEFESTRSSCNCTEVKFEQLKIPARKSVRGLITYKAPNFAKEGKLDFNLLLQRRTLTAAGNSRVVETAALLQFRAYLRGVIDLGQTSHVFEVRDQIDQHLIPIVITEPIKLEDLDVVVSSELKDILAEIEHNQNQIFIVVSAAKNALPSGGIAGSVTVSHRPSQTEKVLLLTVTPQLPLRISPSFLSFSASSRDDRVVEATAIIRVNRMNAEPEEDSERDSRTAEEPQQRQVNERVSISECQMGEFHLEHDLYRLSNSIWKVRFRIAKQNYDRFLERQRQQMEWGEASELEVRFRIHVGENQHEMQVKLFEE
jgi:hypothetical protein